MNKLIGKMTGCSLTSFDIIGHVFKNMANSCLLTEMAAPPYSLYFFTNFHHFDVRNITHFTFVSKKILLSLYSEL